jgi:LmbE family N-acetylglucosaminyl deacetylase
MSEPLDDDHLPLLDDEGFCRVLCVFAHPDDAEYGTSAAAARWVDRGAEVAYLLLTHGEAGMQLPPEEAGPLRAGEQRDACDAVGVQELTMLDHPDGALVYGLDLRRDIARRIRQFRPDVVVTGSWDVEAPWGLNQSDHRAAGISTLDAIRDADNQWVFPELAALGLHTWGVTWFLIGGHDLPTHAVDVTGEPLAKGIASLQAHREYLAALPEHPDPADFLPAMMAEGAAAVGDPAGGVQHAALFRAHRLR